MKYTIKTTFDTSNSAFDGWNLGSEVTNIMDAVGKRVLAVIEEGAIGYETLVDSNGNKVGSVVIIEEDK